MFFSLDLDEKAVNRGMRLSVEVVQFLECLREVKLPTALESIRDNLLVRSKDTLTMSMAERRVERRSASPEPYLDMSAAGPKGLLAASKAEADSEEYVNVENNSPQKQQQDYYEAFQTVGSAASDNLSAANPETSQRPEKQEQLDNILTDIYASLSAAQTENTCQKCGPLYRKEGKKLFVFEQYRLCWVGKYDSIVLIEFAAIPPRDEQLSLSEPRRFGRAAFADLRK